MMKVRIVVLVGASILVGGLSAAAAGSADALRMQALISPGGSGRLLVSNGAAPWVWEACAPDRSSCRPFGRGREIETRGVPSGTVFQVESHGAGGVSPGWRSRLTPTSKPTVDGIVRANEYVNPTSGRWIGGWKGEFSGLQLSTCATAAGKGCTTHTDGPDMVGGSAKRLLTLPAPEQLVPNTIARVAEAPVRRETITRAELRHGLELTAALAGRKPVPGPGDRGYDRLVASTLGTMLEAVWLYGEAAEVGIAVSPEQISRELAAIKREAFRSEAEYREFLAESHYTRRDIRERVELQMLSLRLQRRIQARTEREARNRSEEQQALREWVEEFMEKWRARTVCAPEYAIERCSNGPPLA